VSAGLHFRYATSYNEFSVQADFEGFRHKLALGKDGFDKVWDSVKTQVDVVIDEHQRVLLDKALNVIERLPPAQPSSGPGATATGEEPAWKNCWNWNLCDAAYGSLILDVKEGRISSELRSQGFNFAYRRSATIAHTPNSTSSGLPAAPINNFTAPSQPPTKASTPGSDKPLHPHLGNKSAAPTSPPAATEGGKDSPSSGLKVNGTSEKAEKEKAKRKDKKDKKDKERADRAEASTPDISISTPAAPEPSTSGTPDAGVKVDLDDSKSPVESTGQRTPKTGKSPRHPWTIFMRMSAHLQVTESEIREFYGEAKEGITRVNMPHPFAGKARLVYVEFGDEETMKAGLEQHAETLKDTVPEVKQATDRESRGEPFNRGFGRGRGRGGGGFAARGLSAAGLTRGAGRGNGDANGGHRGESSTNAS